MSLLICGSNGNSAIAAFRRPYLLFGRHQRCAVRLKHPDVSMRHAIAIRFDCGVFLLDLGSRTGIRFKDMVRRAVWLNGQEPVELAGFGIRIEDKNAPISSEFPDPTAGFTVSVDRIPEVELGFTGGPLQGTTYTLKRAVTLIGRGSGCKVCLRDDADISQIHACLILDQRGLFLVDTLSRRGTLVDGKRVRDAALSEGQQFQIGKHVLQVARCRRKSGQSLRVPQDSQHRRTRTVQSDSADAFVQFLYELRDVPEAERPAQLSELLSAGRISAWQSRKLRRRDPARLILDKRYLMVEPVGRGGMGTVYRAFDLDTGEAVAVKKPETRTGNLRRRIARFRREISISSSLVHPHIVRMRDVGQGLRYLVFDFVKGKPLSRLIVEHGPLEPAFVVRWISEVAEALEYAWEQGVIHRDIKPGNIMVTEQNSTMLMDLGLACLSQAVGTRNGSDDERAGITRVGFTVGTIDFMSPEQAAGTDDIDTRSDIYSLGCTMFAALAGRPPFRAGSPVEVARQHLQEQPPSIPGLEPELAAIVDRALRKRPADRFQSPHELREALLQWR